MSAGTLVDKHCYDLACHFMSAKKWRAEDKQELAEAIQQLCEEMVSLDETEDDND